MRPHREAFSKHTVPMNPSDNVHKTVFKPGDTKKPAQTQTSEDTRKGTSSSRCITGRAAVDRRRWARLSSLPEFSLSAHPDLDHIAILQTEMMSQIDVRNDLDNPRISSIPCRSRRRPQERLSTIKTN